MLTALGLLAQVIIAPMSMDSVRQVGDSVEYRLTWDYDTTDIRGFRVDSQHIFWGKATEAPRRLKLGKFARSRPLRFIKRLGQEHTVRTACLRVWSRKVPTLRCVARWTPYLAVLNIHPDSVAFEVDSSGTVRQVYPP